MTTNRVWALIGKGDSVLDEGLGGVQSEVIAMNWRAKLLFARALRKSSLHNERED